MPASRSLTLTLVLLLAPALAEAAPRANAPTEATRPRPAAPPKAAERPTRAPQAAATPVPTTSKPAPVPKASRTAPADRPVPKASSTPRASEPARAARDTGVRTPRPARAAADDHGVRTPRPSAADSGVHTPRPHAQASKIPTPDSTRNPRDTGVRTPRPTRAQDNTGVRPSQTEDSRAPRHPQDTGVRTPRPSQIQDSRTPRHPQDTGVRTPRPSQTRDSRTPRHPQDTGVRTPRPSQTQDAVRPSREPVPTITPSVLPDATPRAADPTAHAPVPKTSTTGSVPEASPRARESTGDAATRAPETTRTTPVVPEATRAPETTRPTPVPEASPGLPRPAPVPEASPAPTRPAPVPEASPAPTRPAPVPEASPELRPAPVPETSRAPDTLPRPAMRPASTEDATRTPLANPSAPPRQPTTVPAAPATTGPTKTARPSPTARPTRLRPQREPLLARHPAATCELDPLEAVGQRQHQRTRESLREFYWSDMARFFETTFDASEPTPRQADDPAFLPAADVIGTLPTAVRGQLNALATARTVDRLSGRSWTKIHKLLSSLSPADVAALLRADAPTLRAHVWTWMATTKTGGCHLGHVDLDFLEAAVADRSVAVEHGDDLVYRSLGDYALEARARLATLDPARFDTFLTRLTAATEVDPLVRATAHGILLRRAHWDTLDPGLRDPVASVRAATASAAIEMNRDKLEARLVEHAASDPVDLVTEQIVGSLLGVHDPHNHGKPQLRGLLATTKDERLTAAVARWRGRGDALAPLPVPVRPLKFTAAPVPKDSPTAPAIEPPQRPSGASPAAAAAFHAREQARTPPAEEPEDDIVLDDDPTTIRVPPLRP